MCQAFLAAVELFDSAAATSPIWSRGRIRSFGHRYEFSARNLLHINGIRKFVAETRPHLWATLPPFGRLEFAKAATFWQRCRVPG
jgi:hypothetical protein